MLATEMLEKLKAIREFHHMRVSTLARMIGVDRRGLARWEEGKVKPNIMLFVDWANALGYDVKLEKRL
jgi:DNA-binding XRE family transcriptional regulator